MSSTTRSNIKGEQVGAFTYDLDWVRHYIERDYSAVDPSVLGAHPPLPPDGLEDARLVEPAGARS